MSSVLSHIVQTRYSQENENIATEALAYILQSSQAARIGLMNLLRGITPDLPSLQFRTQQSEGGARPDMWGFDVTTPRVFVENKFWAGLTDNQPVEYLKLLAGYTQPSILLVVVPAARQETVWRELLRRLHDARVGVAEHEHSASICHTATTDLGPILALTSWAKLLATLEAELADEPRTVNDLLQLRALCDAADSDAFVPLSPAELTDQRTPALILQLNSIVQRAVDLGVSQGFLSIDGTRASASWEQIGRYITFPMAHGIGAWVGIDFGRWRRYGRTPLWLEFPSSMWGRALEVRAFLEPWADREGIAHAMDPGWMSVGINLETGEGLDIVIKSVADCLRDISAELTRLPPRQE